LVAASSWGRSPSTGFPNWPLPQLPASATLNWLPADSLSLDWLVSKIYVTTDGQSAGLSWCQTPIWGPRPDFYYCQTVEGFVTRGASLPRRRVCRLQLLLVLSSAVILGSEPRGTHDHILLSQIPDSPNLEGQVPVFIPPGRWWPSFTPRHWVPFSSPPTTRSAMVEVFEPASTKGMTNGSDPRYIASSRTPQKTNFPTVLLLLRHETIGKDRVENIASHSYSIVVCYEAIA
jgi:hypothetical protein